MTNAPRLDEAPPPVRTGAPANPALLAAATGATLDGAALARAWRPLAIGGVAIGLPVVQAALSGYSDGPMRRVARALGAPYTLGEVVIDRFVTRLKNTTRAARHLGVSDDEHPVGGQLMGSDPDDFAPAARRLVEAGFDVIDVNFGCPVKSAMGGCRGGFHLGQPEVALEIVARVREAVPAHVPVTVKMRRGIDDGDARSREHFFAIFDGAFARGAAAVTVHGRTVAQRYVGPSDWDFLREVKRHAGARTVLGSGDLFDARDCVAMLAHTGVDGVSVARGAIGNPWIFAQARALLEGRAPPVPDLVEQRRVLALHRALCAEVDPSGAASTMRMFGIKFARLHPHEISVRDAFAAARTLSGFDAVLAEWYAD
ncbi:MAG: tRNA-dihydrouridine synthase [Planctomycetes bacterium]|nr:tRNA-dihydrouridine synthase [Planctomycetota bacterium]